MLRRFSSTACSYLHVGQGGPGRYGPGPLVVTAGWLAALGAGTEVMEAAVRPAKTTSIAKMRIASFIIGTFRDLGSRWLLPGFCRIVEDWSR